MKSEKNISLIGFMGAGKTVVGKELANQLNLEFVDLDSLIEAREKMPISEIFAKEGEPYFRKLEKEMVNKVCQSQGVVIACGGGVVLDKENLQNLKQNSRLIYLKASAEVIFERTKNQTHRPLLDVEKPKVRIAQLLKLREPFYTQADYTIDTSKLDVDEVVSKILKILKE
ncbi:MAG: shikimate kinase [Candidatus Omnitrophota bacterium]|nr:shikimate kinase [Candidatus Omnitrophota bacterium]